jgi:hypothetical protein
MVRKELILDQLQDFTIICSGLLKHFWNGSGHGARGRNPKRRFTESQEMVAVCTSKREMVVEVKHSLGFGLSPLFIVVGANLALTFHSASPEYTGCIG